MLLRFRGDMCGICGILHLNNAPVADDLLREITAVLEDRGGVGLLAQAHVQGRRNYARQLRALPVLAIRWRRVRGRGRWTG